MTVLNAVEGDKIKKNKEIRFAVSLLIIKFQHDVRRYYNGTILITIRTKIFSVLLVFF